MIGALIGGIVVVVVGIGGIGAFSLATLPNRGVFSGFNGARRYDRRCRRVTPIRLFRCALSDLRCLIDRYRALALANPRWLPFIGVTSVSPILIPGRWIVEHFAHMY
jgi:hypothetical protein